MIIALTADGQKLGGDHLRVVVPGDKFGGRMVRDITRVDIVSSAQGTE